MGANARSKVLPWILAIVAAALLAVLLVDPFGAKRSPGEEPRREGNATASGADSSSSPPPRASVRSPRVAATGDPDAASDIEPISRAEPDDGAEGLYPVNLEDLRARLPDNLYWQYGQPTRDPEILEMRAEEKRRWNELYGKVLSNTASEEEIHRYYDHRRQISEDYVEVASLVLQEYGDQVPERDRGLYELSLTLHRTRLQEIPRQTEDALARREAHEKLREEWRQEGERP